MLFFIVCNGEVIWVNFSINVDKLTRPKKINAGNANTLNKEYKSC